MQHLLQPWLLFMADDPALRFLQGGMLLCGILVVFLIFYATRDVLLRTHSFLFMVFTILLVAALPLVGFLLYLLMRPSTTIFERESRAMLVELLDTLNAKDMTQEKKPQLRKSAAKKQKKSKGTSNTSLSD